MNETLSSEEFWEAFRLSLPMLWLASLMFIDKITKQLFKMNLIDWLRKEYYELDWMFTQKFLDYIVYTNLFIIIVIAPIIMIILSIGIIAIALKK